MYFTFLVFLLNSSFLYRSVEAYGFDGHKLVADVGFEFLDEQVKQFLTNTLKGDSFSSYAVRPDVYSHCPGGEWGKGQHFINCEDEYCYLERDCMNDRKNGYCVWVSFLNYTSKISCSSDVLVPHRTSELYECAPLDNNPEPSYLENIIHFAGDIHSPVHVCNPELLPRGASYDVVDVLFSEKYGQEVVHDVWDDVIIEEIISRYFEDKYEKYAESMIETLKRDDNKLLKEYQAAGLEYGIYVQETYDISNKYPNDYDHDKMVLGEEYFQVNKDIITLQLMRGGARLAVILNNILGHCNEDYNEL